MNLIVKFMLFGGAILFILDLIEFIRYGSNISIKKYLSFVTWTMIIDLCLVIFNKMGIGMANGATQVTNNNGSLMLYMFFALSIFTFIPGVIKFTKNNNYKEIRSSAIFLAIFFFMFISFKMMGIA